MKLDENAAGEAAPFYPGGGSLIGPTETKKKRKRKKKKKKTKEDFEKFDSLWKNRPVVDSSYKPSWSLPPAPQTDEQLFQQVDMMRSYLGSIVKLTKKREYDTAYVLMDRVAELSANCRTAMEDMEP